MEQHVFRESRFYLEFNNGRIYYCDKDGVKVRCNQELDDYYELIEYYLYTKDPMVF
ncbi:hypothetical protein LASUN_22430 [Lentilactobacillus sunkii]|jgi:hypothetical protein|uniref:Uncharacterized protein n=1 Tax=Lentilactobacillus sunkii TaxID=481719 RepID=A0A1E7X9T1_9LACO|nr:hypothetical protein [Lentilactobacillus sunkii]OFA09761.1 hypothetical protein LASUN_22430 [Lentilactobacillus sunkii]